MTISLHHRCWVTLGAVPTLVGCLDRQRESASVCVAARIRPGTVDAAGHFLVLPTSPAG